MHPLSLVLIPRFPLRMIVGLLLLGSVHCLTSTDIALAHTSAPATVAQGADPWSDSVVDATPIYLVKDLNTATASSVIGQIETLGDAVYFSLYAEGAWELWTTNGMPVETRRLFRFPAADEHSTSIELIGTIRNQVVFAHITDYDNRSLWISDGTSEGTVHWWGTNIQEIVGIVGDSLFLSAYEWAGTSTVGLELLRLKLGEAEPSLVKDIVPGTWGSFPRAGVVSGDRLYFSADNGAPFVTDGTESGTKRITYGGNPIQTGYALALLDGGTLFLARLSSADPEGRPNGVLMLVDNQTGAASVVVDRIEFDWETLGISKVQSIGSQIYFEMSYYPDGFYSPVSDIWVSDGTTAGTRVIIQAPVNLDDGVQRWHVSTRYLDWLAGSEHGQSLRWQRTDLTSGATTELLSLEEGEAYSTCFRMECGFVEIGDDVYAVIHSFVHQANRYFFTLWRADDSQLVSGEASSGLYAELGGKLIFYAEVNHAFGQELAVTDGVSVDTLGDMTASPNEGSTPSDPLPWRDFVVFSALGSDGNRGVWITDGTLDGTQVVMPGVDDAVRYIPLADKVLVLVGQDGASPSLWAIDGDSRRAERVGAWSYGYWSDDPHQSWHTDARFYFEMEGVLWVSDGTVDGTVMVRTDEEEPLDFSRRAIYGFLKRDTVYVFSGSKMWEIEGDTATFAADQNPHAVDLNAFPISFPPAYTFGESDLIYLLVKPENNSGEFNEIRRYDRQTGEISVIEEQALIPDYSVGGNLFFYRRPYAYASGDPLDVSSGEVVYTDGVSVYPFSGTLSGWFPGVIKAEQTDTDTYLSLYGSGLWHWDAVTATLRQLGDQMEDFAVVGESAVFFRSDSVGQQQLWRVSRNGAFELLWTAPAGAIPDQWIDLNDGRMLITVRENGWSSNTYLILTSGSAATTQVMTEAQGILGHTLTVRADGFYYLLGYAGFMSQDVITGVGYFAAPNGPASAHVVTGEVLLRQILGLVNDTFVFGGEWPAVGDELLAVRAISSSFIVGRVYLPIIR